MNEVTKPKLKRNDYLFIFFVFGFCVSTLLIIVFELSWDGVCKAIGFEKGIKRELIECFLRAALIEETFKFLGFMLSRRKYKIARVSDSMFAAGCIGLMYAIVEKVVLFNPMAIIINIFIPMHLCWQWNQGRHYQISKDYKTSGKKGKAFLHLMLATLFIFILHGSWDALISIGAYLIDSENSGVIANAEMIGGIILGVTILLGLIYTVITFVITIKTARKGKREYLEETKEIENKVLNETIIEEKA